MNENTTAPRRTMLGAEAREYPGGYSDADVAEIGTQDGAAGVGVTDTFGENTVAHGAGLVTAAHDAQVGMIGHELAGVLGELDRRCHAIGARFATTTARFTREVGVALDAMQHRANVAHVRRSLGLGDPRWWAPLALFGVLVALFLGEIGLLASALQSMGLSDTPLIPGVPLTDELHIAALAAVVSLALVAHAVGDTLKVLKTDADLRRTEIEPRVRARFAKLSRFAMVLAGVAGLCGLVAVAGMVLIRGEYLAESGSEITSGPFILIQVALLAAAVLAAYHFSDPTAHAWRDAAKKEDASIEMAEASLASLDSDAGEHNSIAQQRETEITAARHHVGVDRANAVRQSRHLYPRQVLHASPEPVAAKLFATGFPELHTMTADEIRAGLLGKAAEPVAELNTDRWHRAWQRALAAVRAREAELRAVLDERVLPTRPADEFDYAVGAQLDADDALFTDDAEDDGLFAEIGEAPDDVAESAVERDTEPEPEEALALHPLATVDAGDSDDADDPGFAESAHGPMDTGADAGDTVDTEGCAA